TQIAMETAKDMALKAFTLPEDLRKYLNRATRGDLEVRVKGVQEGARTIYAVGRQIIYTAIGIAFGAASLQLHMNHDDRLARPLAYVALGAGALLVLSSIFARPHSRR
ncbi:MAG: hypothetical protein ABI183_23565, partial [Polyangiaceae bacterium]